MSPDPFMQALPKETVLPNALRRVHGTCGNHAGCCSVAPGRGWLVRMALRLAGMPREPGDIPVRLQVTREGAEWSWIRDFDGHVMRSRLTYSRNTGYVHERFGWISIWMKPVFGDGRLELQITRLSCFGIPCPAALLPRSKTSEWQDETGRFRFDVSAEMPFLGTLIRYKGWLRPEHVQAGEG